MPILEISIVPVGTKTASFSSFVEDAARVIERKGLPYQVTPTATVVEGELDELLNLVKDIHQSSFKDDTQRVVTSVTIDDRIDQPMSLNQEVNNYS